MMKRVLASTILLLMLQNAYAANIVVNTTEDQDDEDFTKCSLREAIIASNTKKAYGGCIAGERFYVDLIQLYDSEKSEDSNTPKVFNLKEKEFDGKRYKYGELLIQEGVVIRGTRALSYLKTDQWNNASPARLPLSVTIKAATGTRIFNSSASRAALTLENVILDGGQANLGGAIRAGGSVILNRVEIKNAQATDSGGALYLEGTSSSLTATDVLMHSNQAPKGAVVSMTCLDSLVATTRTLNMVRTSVVNNGSSQSESVVDVCGIPTATITASTFGDNTTMVGGGKPTAVLRFKGSVQAELGNLAGNIGRVATVGMTLTNNQSDTAFAYDDLNLFTIQNSVLAFNSVLDCQYVGNRAPQLNERMAFFTNFVGGSLNAAVDAVFLTNRCQVGKTTTTNSTTNIYQDTATFSDILYPLGNYGAYTLGYLPKLAASATAKTLVDKGVVVSQCLEVDQRSISRASGFKSKVVNTEDPRCDIGAFEYSQLTANDDNDVANTSYTAELDKKITDLTDKEVDELPEYDREIVRYQQKELKEYLVSYKADYTYRRAYVPILINDVGGETVTANNTSQFQQIVDGIKSGAYKITAESLGTGRDLVGINLTGTAAELDTFKKNARAENNNYERILCAWVGTPTNAQGQPLAGAGAINKLAIWADNSNQRNFSRPYATPSGEYERCLYTLTYMNGNQAVNVYAVAQARLVNIKPTAKDDTYNLPYGTKQISLDILSNDNDEGDAPLVNGKYLDYPEWPQFYKAPRFPGQPEDISKDLPIRIVKKPALGELQFERQGVCPDVSDTRPTEICYGGKLVYVSDNLFSKFNDDFEYEVLDGDKGVSNKAVVNIINTATTDDQEKAGGGAVGVGALLALLGLAVIRRRIK